MRKTREKCLLYIGVCAALTPLLLLRDFTPSNELRYLSIADEALRNHTFFTFSNHGVPYTDKPPLYLWLVMLFRWLTGAHRMWLLGLISLIPACGILRVMDRWTEKSMGSDGRQLAQWLLLTCGLFLGAAITVRMDMLMCWFIVLALHAFWRMQSGEGMRDGSHWRFPLYLFLAVFTKGPLGLLIPLASTVVFLVARKRTKEVFRYWGWRTWGVLLLCFALWFGAVYAEGGSQYLHDLLFKQTAGRAVHAFHHAHPAYYYALAIWYCLAPWSLLVIGTVTVALRPKCIRSDLQCFFLTVGATTFVLLSAISSKLSIYLLPAIPFLVYATAMFLPRYRQNLWMRLAVSIPAGVFALALPALAVTATVLSSTLPYLKEGLFYASATILSLSGGHAIYLLYNRKQPTEVAAVVKYMALGLLLALFTGGWAIPKVNVYTGYKALAEEALTLSQAHHTTHFRTWRVSRPEGMDVYLHHPVDVIADEDEPHECSKPSLLLIPQEELTQFKGLETHQVGPYAIVVCPGVPANNAHARQKESPKV